MQSADVLPDGCGRSGISKSPQVQHRCQTTCDCQEDAVPASIQASRQRVTETGPMRIHAHHNAVLHWLQQSFDDTSRQQAETLSSQLSTEHPGDTLERADVGFVPSDHARAVADVVQDRADLVTSLSASKLYSCFLR